MLLDCEGIPDRTQLDLLLPQTSDDPFSSPTIQQSIHFRCAEPPTPNPNPNKYSDELLDAYIFVGDADALYAE
jgi:hypothetical protein